MAGPDSLVAHPHILLFLTKMPSRANTSDIGTHTLAAAKCFRDKEMKERTKSRKRDPLRSTTAVTSRDRVKVTVHDAGPLFFHDIFHEKKRQFLGHDISSFLLKSKQSNLNCRVLPRGRVRPVGNAHAVAPELILARSSHKLPEG